MRILSFFIALFALAAVATTAAPLGCLNEKGKPVDWFVAIKGPNEKQTSVPYAPAGHAYVYMDNDSIPGGFQLSPNDISSNSGAIASTISQLYNAISKDSSGNDVGYIFYNDEHPDSTQGRKTKVENLMEARKAGTNLGHTKGVVGFSASGKQGFWLIHSTPKFPEAPGSGYSFPDSGSIYGQSYLCITLDFTNLDTVGQAFGYNYPSNYAENWPNNLAASAMPNMQTFIVNGANHFSTAGSFTDSLTSVGGDKFVLFAKNAKWGQDLYSDLVAPAFKTGLIIESWMRPHEPSYYPPQVPYAAINVVDMQFPGGDLTWGETDDHSKWCMSTSSSAAVVCIGDINRQKSQWSRGGGTVCMQQVGVYKAYAALVTSTDPLNPSK